MGWIAQRNAYGRVYFFPSITGLTTETFSQKVSICAAVAATAGTLWAAGLGTVARGPLPRRRRPHKLFSFEILNLWLRKFWSEIGPNGARTDSEWTFLWQALPAYEQNRHAYMLPTFENCCALSGKQRRHRYYESPYLVNFRIKYTGESNSLLG